MSSWSVQMALSWRLLNQLNNTIVTALIDAPNNHFIIAGFRHSTDTTPILCMLEKPGLQKRRVAVHQYTVLVLNRPKLILH